MIPRLKPGASSSALYIDLLTELRAHGFEGDISTKYADRTVLATDNSIYQLLPQAVIFPRTTTDVVRLAKLAWAPCFRAIKLAPRGGGTGTNGQSLTDGLVVDFSRHMNSILEINAEEKWARVQAGVVKDQLNVALKSHGLFFAPELSPSNRATIGGMIATDASGQGSVLYGKTRNHVLELNTVFLDGTCWRSAALEERELETIKRRQDQIGAVHRLLDRIREQKATLIAERFVALNRCVTGYDLAHIRDERGAFNLNSILCGAEGTLGLVTEAKLRLTLIPRHSALVNVRYGNFDCALRDAPGLMEMGAASSETVDGKVLALARESPIWLDVKEYFPDDAVGDVLGANLVEFLAEDEAALEAKLAAVTMALSSADRKHACRGFTIARATRAKSAIWAMRKKAVELLGNMQGDKRPIPFVEDTAVPPERLADYIAEFRAALDRRGLEYGMFGHADAGCLHVRPAIDMKDPAQELLIREITDEVFALTTKYKGVLWGEHGKGMRSEYAPEFFGPLYACLQDIKAAFDPYNQLNPGKIATPPGYDLLKVNEVGTRGQLDRQIPANVRHANSDSLHCNGNAACYNFDPDDAMCPSWKATRERRHSPKGRASLLREWLRLLAEAGEETTSPPGRTGRYGLLMQLCKRAIHTYVNRRNKEDFSHAVKEAMDGCLACKSCVGQCPIKIDVPAFRSRFLETYHTRYLRPARDHLIAGVERSMPWFARAPRLYNAVIAASPVRAALSRVGVVALPLLDTTGMHKQLASRRIRHASVQALAAVSGEDRQRSVIIVQDAFTSCFESKLVLDLYYLFEHLGFIPWIAPYKPNGKPLHVMGFLKRFQIVANENAAMLNALAATGVSLVGVDPSMTLSYRAEYVKALGIKRAPRVDLPQEWLVNRIDQLPQLVADSFSHWQLLPHCTERTNMPEATRDWKRVCARLGVNVDILAAGCCGMAGLFGHEAAKRSTSQQIYRLSWAAHVASTRKTDRLLATGYSCRSQVALIDGVALLHPIQILLAHVKRESMGNSVISPRRSNLAAKNLTVKPTKGGT
jgi:FAD/FMN-containing dehydrogenase/Fe-S oxidoreductase